MFIIQAVVPATLVFIVFITAHLFVENEGSGIYLPDTNWDFDTEEVFPVPVEEIDPSLIDPETGGLLPEKYNYLKVENVFSGKIIGSEKLFSIEVALLTKQSSVLSDLFISALAEIEADVVAEITNVILEVELGQLESVDGRKKLTNAIRDHVNEYLEEDLDMFPGITEVFIINYNVIYILDLQDLEREKMKHEVLKAEIKEERLDFLFECNYFDNTGNINNTKRFSTALLSDLKNNQYPNSSVNSID